MDNSSFASLAITQTGGSPAVVELGNDTIPGTAAVSEGNANSDSITVDNGNVFRYDHARAGRAGRPVPATSLGTSDTVSVTNATTKDLDIQQLLNGTTNHVNVDTVSVASTSFGVATSQGNGAGDTTTINLVTTPTPPTSQFTWRWPAQHRRRSGQRSGVRGSGVAVMIPPA